jgi:hypothetical protein
MIFLRLPRIGSVQTTLASLCQVPAALCGLEGRVPHLQTSHWSRLWQQTVFLTRHRNVLFVVPCRSTAVSQVEGKSDKLTPEADHVNCDRFFIDARGPRIRR